MGRSTRWSRVRGVGYGVGMLGKDICSQQAAVLWGAALELAKMLLLIRFLNIMKLARLRTVCQMQPAEFFSGTDDREGQHA